MRFEHLVRQPRETLMLLAEFCGLTPSDADMDAAVAMVRAPAPAMDLPKKAGPKIGRYRELNPAEQAVLTDAIELD